MANPKTPGSQIGNSAAELSKDIKKAKTEFQQLSQLINNNQGALKKFSDSFKSIADSMKNVVKGNRDFLRAMSNIANNAVSHAKQIQTLAASINQVAQAGQGLAAVARGGGGGAGGGGGGRVVRGGGAGGGIGAGQMLAPLPGGGFAVMPMTPQAKRQAQAQQQDPGLSALSYRMSQGQALTGYGAQAANYIANAPLNAYKNLASVRQVRGDMTSRMLGGDYSDLLAQINMSQRRAVGGTLGMGGWKGDVVKTFGDTSFQTAGNALGSIGQVLGAGATGAAGAGGAGAAMGVLAGSAGGVANAFNYHAQGGREVMQAQNMQAGSAEMQAIIDPRQKALMQLQMQWAPALLAADKRAGRGGGMGFGWMGAANGMDLGSSLAAGTEMANKWGSTGLRGRPGRPNKMSASEAKSLQRQLDAALGKTHFGMPEEDDIGRQYGVHQPKSTLSAEDRAMNKVLFGKGFLPKKQEEVAEKPPQMVGGTKGMAEYAFELNRKGFDIGATSDFMGTFRGMMGSGKGMDARNSESQRQLRAVIAAGVSEGFDMNARESIVKSVTNQMAGGATGDWQDVGMVARLLAQGGGTKRDVEVRERGLDTLSQIQNDPYLQAVNYSAARGILGDDASPEATKLLAGASLKQLAGSPEMFKDLGINNKDQQMQMVDAQLNATLGTDDWKSAMDDPSQLAKVMMRLTSANGGDYSAAKKSLNSLRDFDPTKGMDDEKNKKIIAGLDNFGSSAASSAATITMQGLVEAMSDTTVQDTFKSATKFWETLKNSPNAGWQDAEKLFENIFKMASLAGQHNFKELDEFMEKLDNDRKYDVMRGRK
jgi:hypothetical protein